MFYRSVSVENIEKHQELVSMVPISAQKNKNTQFFSIFQAENEKRKTKVLKYSV